MSNEPTTAKPPAPLIYSEPFMGWGYFDPQGQFHWDDEEGPRPAVVRGSLCPRGAAHVGPGTNPAFTRPTNLAFTRPSSPASNPRPIPHEPVLHDGKPLEIRIGIATLRVCLYCSSLYAVTLAGVDDAERPASDDGPIVDHAPAGLWKEQAPPDPLVVRMATDRFLQLMDGQFPRSMTHALIVYVLNDRAFAAMEQVRAEAKAEQLNASEVSR